jgi:hypothetical protein
MAQPITCPYCNGSVPVGRVSCPHCGQRLPDYLRAQALAAKEQERARKEAERQAALAEKERLRQHVQSRVAEAERRNADLKRRLTDLEFLLSRTLSVDDHVTVFCRPDEGGTGGKRG